MSQPVFLRIFNGDKLEGIKQFQVSQIVIGSNEDTQVVLQGQGIGPLHALIEQRDGGYYLSDLGSASGTLRNNQPILDERLESGDEITVGGYRIQFFIGIPKPLSGPTIASSAKGLESSSEPYPELKSKPTPASIVPPTPNKQVKPVSNEVKKAEASMPKVTSTPVSGASAVPRPKGSSRGTYAPPSQISDLNRIFRPGKGSLVEIAVVWKDRILSCHHFNERREITVGTDPSADISVPILGKGSAFPLVKIGALATIRITGQMSGDFTRDNQTIPIQDLLRQNRLRGQGSVFELDLNQGEMVRVGFVEDLISIYIRYTTETPKPFVAPLFDLTASEVTGVILATVVASIFGLYMMVYAPQNMDEDQAKVDEPIRMATVTFKPPKVTPQEEQKPPQEPPKQEKKLVKVEDKAQAEQKMKSAKAAPDPGKAAEVAPKETKDKQKKMTSAKPGGAIKTAPKEGANAKSEKPDPTKVGLLGVFGSKGAQTKLDKAYSGSGELQGLADTATGNAGSAEDRPGEGFGTKLKDTGAGGKGTSTVGIAGVGTKGKGSGSFGYGTGGLGEKGNVGINLEGQEAEFKGSMDKEAIRRVILANKPAIRHCYDLQLNRNAELFGKIVVEWTITEGGRVKEARIKSNTLGNSEVANCLLARLRTFKFPDPPPDTEGQVSYPFVFASQ